MKPLALGVAVRLLAIDPGETSGYIQAVVESPEPPLFEFTITRIGTWSGCGQLLELSRSLFADAGVVVCEDYRIYPNRLKSHSGARPYTLLELGRIELLAFRYDIVVPSPVQKYPAKPLIYQAASMAKQRWPNNRIRKWIARAQEPVDTVMFNELCSHERDALRHLLTFLERDGGQV